MVRRIFQDKKNRRRLRVKRKVRAKIYGTSKVPRLSVFRSNKHIYAQIVDDEKGNTLVFASDLEFNEGELKNSKKTKLQRASTVGELLAKKALRKKIKKIVFDRNGYKYHGRVKALAEGARKGGLIF